MLAWSALGALAWGQPARPGRGLPGAASFPLIDTWVKQQALGHYLEWSSDDLDLSLWNYYSALGEGSPRLRFPLLVLQSKRSFSLAVGAQQGLNIDPALAFLPFEGVRGELDLKDLRVGVAIGRTTQPDLFRLLGTDYAHYKLASAHLNFPLSDQGAGRVALTYLGSDRDAEQHWLAGLELDPQWDPGLAATLAVSRDLGSTQGDASMYRWTLSHRDPQWDVLLRQYHVGNGFGPRLDFFSLQGTDLLSADLNWRPQDGLQFTESFRLSKFDSTPLGRFSSTSSTQWSQGVQWSPSEGLDVALRYQQSQLQSGQRTNQQSTLEGRLKHRLNSQFSWEIYRTQQNLLSLGVNQTYTNQGVSANYSPSEAGSLFARVESSRSQGPLYEQKNQYWSAGYSYRLPQDGGDVSLGLGQYSFASPGISSSFFSLTGRANLRLSPRWRFQAQHERGSFVGRTLAEISYLWDHNQEFVAGYRHDPQFFAGLPLDLGIAPTEAFYLQLRQSWGGPLQKSFESRLDPRIRVRVWAHPPDSDEQIPLSNVGVQLGEKIQISTNEAGEALLVSKAGSYPLTIDAGLYGANYEFQEVSKELDLHEADREEVDFSATAWSSLRAVTFNDEAGKGTLPMGYVPVQDIPVQVAEQTKLSNRLGMTDFLKLKPGKYLASIDTSRLAPGFVLTTPAVAELEIGPGQQATLPFGVQGRATLAGQVRLRGKPNLPRPVNLYLGETWLCKTDSDGRFAVSVPAGTLNLKLNWSELGGDCYAVESAPQDWVIQPNQKAEVNFVGSRYARLKVRFRRQGKPLIQGGIAVQLSEQNFVYTDENGVAQFDEVPEGKVTLQVVKETLPQGTETRPLAPIQIGPGEVREIWVDTL